MKSSYIRPTIQGAAWRAISKIAIVGTSLCQHNTNATSTPKISNWARGWMNWCRVQGPQLDFTVWHSGGADAFSRYFVGANHGVSGQNSDEIIARLSAVLASNPDMVIVDCGTNDISNGYSLDDIVSYSRTIYDFFRARGVAVLILPILARAASSWSAGGTERRKAAAVNAWRRAYSIATGCYYFDWNAAWVEPTNTNGEPKSGYSDDGTHFNIAGAQAVGKALADYLSAFMPPRQPHMVGQDEDFDATYNLAGSIHPNPLSVGTSGVAGTGVNAGNIATSMRIERSSGTTVTVTPSKETRPDGKGDYQVMTFTPGGSAVERFYYRTNTSDTPHSFSAGDWVRLYMDVDVSAYAGWKSIQLYCKDQGSGGMTSYDLEEYDIAGTLQPFPSVAWSGTLVTPPIQIVPGSTTIRTRLEMALDGAVAGTPVIKAGGARTSRVYKPSVIWI